MTHALGLITLASQLLGAPLLVRWLWVSSRESRSWRRPVHVPRFAGAVVPLSSGADFVGVV